MTDATATPFDPVESLARIRAKRPFLWTSDSRDPSAHPSGIHAKLTVAAAARMQRFQPLVARLFPELQADGGRIRSELRRAPGMQQAMGVTKGQVWIKCDHALPLVGSIKARGGFHEVFEHAEALAGVAGVTIGGGSGGLDAPNLHTLFAPYEIVVGSTGNLGLAVGTMSAALGLRAVVHMSSDASEWKKSRLRERGVTVVEHSGDYAEAVAAGRRRALGNPDCHFVDDENSASLFAGYSTAATELHEQLAAAGVVVDAQHPLFVYLPCGVGGAPGGIAHGLAAAFGPFVHCFFAEPVNSPCVLINLVTGRDDAVYDHGLDNRTEADGLAVPRASRYAVDSVRHLVSGVCTMRDEDLLRDLYLLEQSEGMRVEPSAAAGFAALRALCNTGQAERYLSRHGLDRYMHQATHIVWTTGGALLPEVDYWAFHDRGSAIATRSVHPYYESHREALEAAMRHRLDLAEPMLRERAHLADIATIRREIMVEFDIVLAQMPYVGGADNRMSNFFMRLLGFLAFGRVLQRHGVSLPVIGDIARETLKAQMLALPEAERLALGQQFLSPENKALVREQAAMSRTQSHREAFPDDFVYRYVEPGPGDSFELGIDYSDCGFCKFAARHGDKELIPSICGLDVDDYATRGIKLVRTHTLAGGASHCDFRFSRK